MPVEITLVCPEDATLLLVRRIRATIDQELADRRIDPADEDAVEFSLETVLAATAMRLGLTYDGIIGDGSYRFRTPDSPTSAPSAN